MIRRDFYKKYETVYGQVVLIILALKSLRFNH